MANIGNVLVPVPAPEPSPSLDVNNELLIIDVCVLLTAAALSILVVCGSARRCYYSKFLRLLVQGAYMLSAMLISHTLGQIVSTSLSIRNHNEFFAIWAVFLFGVLGGADCISAFSLEDNEQWRKNLYTYYGLSVLTGCSVGPYLRDTKFLIPLLLLWLLSIYLGSERVGALVHASKYGIERNVKDIAYHMSREHGEPREAETIDPISMTGYKYPVKLQKGYTITVDEVWRCKGKLLASTEDDQDSNRKDICLSYALFNILCCRFAGYDLSEYLSHEQTSTFVREGLLSDEDRAFRVIEVELAYLYDLFYTKYFAIVVHTGPKYRFLQFCILMISCYLVAISLIRYSPPRDYANNIIMGHHVELTVTVVAIAVFFFGEVIQVALFVFSYMAKLYLLCKYVEKASFQQSKIAESITRIVCDTSIPGLKPWGRKMGQYSMLASFHVRPSKAIFDWYTSPYFDRPRGRAESRPVKLPTQVKTAVLNRIKTIVHDSLLTNGVTSLRNNGVENDLSWACRLKKPVQVIMVWHIATSMCEYSTLKQSPSGNNTALDDYITVATSLSKYCAYLVAFAPRLLPGHAYEAEVTLDGIVGEATEFFGGRRENMERLHAKLMSPQETQNLPQESVIKQSARLGRELLTIVDIGDEMRRWKILSDFWTDMILFLAPSGDASAHAEHLATGGEFVMHLWALLFHAAIDGRDPTINQNV